MNYTEFQDGMRVALSEQTIQANLRAAKIYSVAVFVKSFLQEIDFVEDQDRPMHFTSAEMRNITIFQNDTHFMILKGDQVIKQSVVEIRERQEYPQFGYVPFFNHELKTWFKFEGFINHTLDILRESQKDILSTIH